MLAYSLMGLAVYCMATPAGLVLFDAPGGPGLVDFLESKLRAAGLESAQTAAVLLTSCGPEATAGLGALVEKTGCCVVASKAGRRSVEARCPPGTAVLSQDDLLSAGWLEARALPLEGLGVAPMAYQLRWQGKTVLVSGRIPMKINRWTALDLAKALAGSDGDAELYLRSVRQLGALKPDIWLPSTPLNGQNASLDRDEWAETIADNERATPHTK